MKALGPHSRATVFAGLDGRSSDARAMRRVKIELIAHVGGKPSATQKALIERIVMLGHQIALMDARHSEGGWTERDGRQYLAWVNSHSRLIGRLGMKSAAQAPRTLEQHIAERRAA